MVNENYIFIKKNVDKIISEMGIIPNYKIIKEILKVKFDIKCFNEFYIKNYGHELKEYYRNQGYRALGDVVYNGEIIPPSELTLEIIKDLIVEFKDVYNRIPAYSDYTFENNLPFRSTFSKILKKNNIKMNEFMTVLGEKEDFTLKGYNYCLNKLKECIKNNNGEFIPIKYFGKYNLPCIRWYIQECNNPNVKTSSDFIREELGLIPIYDISKEEVIYLIRNMIKDLNRPLMYDDFRLTTTQKRVNICHINKYFGSMNNMKKELGLEIIQDDMVSKHVSDINVIKEDLLNICRKVELSDKRKIINAKDINKYTKLNIKFSSISKNCKAHNTTIRDIIEGFGYELQKEGMGITNLYSDGEKTRSSYEKQFSDKLREYGYLYNKDYYRDIKYKEFINNYDGLLDCDYIIKVNESYIFIEVACLLDENQNYKEYNSYKSNSKKKYAKKLIEKENMFIKENLNYFLLFVSDFKKYNLDFLFTQKLGILKKEVI